MLNACILMGRLTANPELRTTQTGKSVVSFSLAVDRDFQQNGEKQADFISVVAWGKTAEFVCRYFAKGRMIAVQGRLQARMYTDKEGNKRKAVEVAAEKVSFTGEPKKAESAAEKEPPAEEPGIEGYVPAGKQRAPVADSVDDFQGLTPDDDFQELPSDDDLPF